MNRGYRKLVSFSLHHPRTIVWLWVGFVVLFGIYAVKLPSVLKDHGLLPAGAYVEVQQMLSADFHIPEDPVILVFENRNSVPPEQFRRYIQSTLAQVREVSGLTQLVSPLDRDGMMQEKYAYAQLAFKQQPYEMKPVLQAIEQQITQHRDISVKMTGKSVVQKDVNQASQHDLRRAELVGIPAAFVILWLAFGGIVTAVLPVILGVVSVTGTMGIMYGLGTQIELSNFVLNVIPMVGLALSIDFALIVVSRFREEVGHASVEQALVITMQTAGRAVLFSTCSVLLGLASLLLIRLPIFYTVAMGAMVVVAVSVLLTFTLLPAALSLLGDSIQAEARNQKLISKSAIWQKWAAYVMHRPVRMVLLASLLLLGCLLPLGDMKLAIPDATSLPKGYDSRTAAQIYEARWAPPLSSHIYLIAEGYAPSLGAADWRQAYALVQRLEHDPQVRQVDSAFSVLRMKPEELFIVAQKSASNPGMKQALSSFVQQNRMLIHITLKGSPEAKATMDWTRYWEQEGKNSILPYRIGGEAKYQQEVFDEMFNKLGLVLLFVVTSNYLVLFLAFRSVLIPIKAILMNLLSLGAAFGILVWLFQEGHLGMEPTRIAIMIPIFIFGLAFGISMDYGVFLLSRMYEVYQHTKDNDFSVREGLSSTSRVITSAAAIMIAVTAPFALGGVVGVRQLGVGIAAAIAIDATIVRLILVPSLMKLLGRWNWWSPNKDL